MMLPPGRINASASKGPARLVIFLNVVMVVILAFVRLYF